jgi:hypothetical protein
VAADLADYCDPRLSRLATGGPEVRYQLRPESNPDRCEGRYAETIAAGSAVRIVSFTRRVDAVDPRRLSRILLEWPLLSRQNPRGDTIIVAQGQRPRVYYRMDTRRPFPETSFPWPTQVLLSTGTAADDLGVVAFTRVTIDGRSREVYLPLSVGPLTGLAREPGYTVGVVPSTELSEATVSVSDAITGAEVHRPAPLRGYYPAEHAFTVRIPLGVLPRSGLYRFAITVKQRNRGAGHSDFIFAHPR